MRYTLHDYQSDAVRGLLRNLTRATAMYQQFRDCSHFALSATTGAGKTVVAAAVIEALFFGSDEYDFQANPGAVVLWFSDDPSLNEQSRARIQAAAPELDSRLKVIEATFAEPKLEPGHVYFLNTQKLSRNSRLVKAEREAEPTRQLHFVGPRPDKAQVSFYDTLRNTMEDERLTLFFVLDEAHRGVGGGTSRERDTIVLRLINGQNGVPPLPVVWGISATVERFEKAMSAAKERIGIPSVVVDSSLVQASGLLKDDIVLHIPTEAGVFDTVLLKRAVENVRASTAAWAAYATDQDQPDPVVPLLVVQVGDKPCEETLVRKLDTIYEHWPELRNDAVANVFGEHNDLLLRQQVVPYISPERVQEATHIRVLLAKSAISTGWDCPRAEVLVSFRPAVDRTHITQLLGRMIRTPLARRIPGNELLNSVDCLLPFFDRKTAMRVAEMLMRGATSKDDEEDGSSGGEGRRVLFDPVKLLPNPEIAVEVWECFAGLPTFTIPRKGVKPIRRLTALAAALSRDALVDRAVEKAHAYLHKVLDGRAVQYSAEVAASRHDVVTMHGEILRARLGVGFAPPKSFQESADYRAIEAQYRHAGRILSPAIASSYAEHLAGVDANDDDLLEAHIQVAALAFVAEIAKDVEEEADELARAWLTQTRVDRKGLPDERQVEYDRLEGMSTKPERIALTAPKTAQADTKVRHADGDETDLPTRTMHLMAAEDGTFPIDLNEWERQVLDSEMSHPGFKGWYRNPGRALKESLAVAYKDPATGDWRALRPDFIFFATQHDGTVVADLVDPHGHHLSDALPKLRGLAYLAEHHGEGLRRVESVAETGGKMRVLDLTEARVRDAIRTASDAKALYLSDLARDY